MTVAVCMSCGAYKKGALTKCAACQYEPTSIEYKAISMCLSDHNCTETQLAAHSSNIKNEKPPYIDRKKMQEYIALLESEQGKRISGLFDHILKKPSQEQKSTDASDKQRVIAQQILLQEDSANGSVRMLANPYMADGICRELVAMGFKKSFLRSATQHIYDCVLSHDAATLLVLPLAMLVAVTRDNVYHNWNGSGKYCGATKAMWQPADFTRKGIDHVSIMIYITPLFAKVSHLLEHPTPAS